MKLGFGHGPRFHLNLFSPRCRWPCITQTASSIGSNSTSSSFLDNDHTSSWTYIQYHNAQRDSDPGSTLNDIELISLINQGSLAEGEESGNGISSAGASGGEAPWQSPSERHARRDVRTLFPENPTDEVTIIEPSSSGGASSEAHYVNLSQENLYVNLAAGASCRGAGHPTADAQYMNLPFPRELVPVYSASNGSNRSSNSNGRQSLSSALFDDSEDLFPGGDHPYGIPSSLLGGVLLNLDNQFRLSANSEWENWSEFLTDSDTSNNRNNNAERSERSSIQRREADRTSGGSSSLGAVSEELFNNEVNNDTFESDISEDSNQNVVPHNTPNLIGGSVVPPGHVALPAPPSSNSSTRSSRSSSGPQQQEWYFYDPRLVPESRTERVTLDTSFRGLRNRCFMSSIIQPPSYDELMNESSGAATGDVGSPAPGCGSFGEVLETDTMDFDPPPPYTDSGPPPSYEQTFGHTLALPSFNLGLPINPLERRLAASLCTARPLVTPNMTPDPDLLTDVNIDELLEGTSPPSATADINQTGEDDDDNDNLCSHVDIEDMRMDDDDLPAPDNADYNDEFLFDNNGENNENTDDEDMNNNFSPRRYPVGFCLGRRPPLRWSRGMSPNRWTPTENWALH